MDEFSLIERYFKQSGTASRSAPIVVGIGDDAAVVEVPANRLLVQSIDTLVAGRHFPDLTDPHDLAHKALAVNISDLAAMAAAPAYFLLSLTLPMASARFAEPFAAGLFEAAERYGVALIGGDTCRGPLAVTIQVTGFVAADCYVTRAGARPGDAIYVSGQLGAAALGLADLQGELSLDPGTQIACRQALNRPQPRLDLVPLLAKFASAAIDLSDGLAGDLKHVLQSSHVGAVLEKAALPVHPWIAQHDRYDLALSGGDDYQILFTVPATKVGALEQRIEHEGLDITRIGEITGSGYQLRTNAANDKPIDLANLKGFDHFGG